MPCFLKRHWADTLPASRRDAGPRRQAQRAHHGHRAVRALRRNGRPRQPVEVRRPGSGCVRHVRGRGRAAFHLPYMALKVLGYDVDWVSMTTDDVRRVGYLNINYGYPKTETRRPFVASLHVGRPDVFSLSIIGDQGTIREHAVDGQLLHPLLRTSSSTSRSRSRRRLVSVAGRDTEEVLVSAGGLLLASRAQRCAREGRFGAGGLAASGLANRLTCRQSRVRARVGGGLPSCQSDGTRFGTRQNRVRGRSRESSRRDAGTVDRARNCGCAQENRGPAGDSGGPRFTTQTESVRRSPKPMVPHR